MHHSEHSLNLTLRSTHQALEGLYGLAAGVCQEILAFQPDLLVSLAHSDIGPLRAAQAYWGETQSTTFPPTVRINFGVEKQQIYEQWRLGHGMDGYDSRMATKADAGHFQAWMSRHERYQANFHDLLARVPAVNVAPRRVLILDEISHGATRSVAFGLLHGLYPQAELRFIAGKQDWTNAMGEAWLNAFFPAFWEELELKKTDQSLRYRFPTSLHDALKQIVVGTQDCDLDSLYWQPLQASNPAVQKLMDQGLPLDGCMSCSGWVQSQIEQYVSRRVSGQQQPLPMGDKEPCFETWPFPPEERAWIEIWNANGISLSRWAEICGVRRWEAREMILEEWQFYHNLQPIGFGSQTRYRVDPIFLPELPPEEARDRSVFLSLRDGQILAQGYPGQSVSFATIIAEQIDFVIDLTMSPSAPATEHYYPNRNPDWSRHCYHDWLRKETADAGQQIEIQNFPIRPFSVPAAAQMAEILNAIDHAVKARKKILVHDLWGNERTGLVLGCYLVRHGMQPDAAVQLLNRQLAQTRILAYRIPGTEAQYRFILNWKKRQ